MKIAFTAKAERAYQKLSPTLQEKAAKQFDYLLSDLRHPSLHAKKYDESRGVWQGRIDRAWRFYFVIEGDTYYIIAIIAHPK